MYNQDALYVGMTNNLEQRIIEHLLERGKPESDAGKYYCYNLVFYEEYKYENVAIEREKEIKKWRREKKEALIHSINPELKTLNKKVFGQWPLTEDELCIEKISNGLRQISHPRRDSK